MRLVVSALAIIFVLAIWLVTQYRDEPQRPALVERYLPPDRAPRDADVPVEPEDKPQAIIADEAISSFVPNGSDDPSTEGVRVDFGADMRAGIVNFFSEGGLAETDSERIADSILEGAEECAQRAFRNVNVGAVLDGGNGDLRRNEIETCMFNVFADHGLREFPVAENQLAISAR